MSLAHVSGWSSGTPPPHAYRAVQLVDGLVASNVKEEIRDVTLAFTYLGCATLVAHFFETAMFMWSGALLPADSSVPWCHINTCHRRGHIPTERGTSMQ